MGNQKVQNNPTHHLSERQDICNRKCLVYYGKRGGLLRSQMLPKIMNNEKITIKVDSKNEIRSIFAFTAICF